MYSSTDTERAHAPVEISKPVENETNYRAKQNNMKTDVEPLLIVDSRNLSIPARRSVSSSRPLSVQLCRCTTAVILGALWAKGATPYDNCISAGHLALEKNVVFKRGVDLRCASLKRGRLLSWF